MQSDNETFEKSREQPSAGGPSKSKSRQLCVYCQERPASTVEHVIAQGFFGSMQPKHAVKVPACRECNEGCGDGGPRRLTMDEEYARTILATEARSLDHPVASKLHSNEIQRSFDKSSGLLRRIGKTMRRGDVKTSAGIIIPDVPLMTVETERVARVLQKITRGLFYAVNRRALPRAVPVMVTVPLNASQFKLINGMINLWKPHTRWWHIGLERAFSFRCAMNNAESVHSIWLMCFYESIVFCTHTLPVVTK